MAIPHDLFWFPFASVISIFGCGHYLIRTGHPSGSSPTCIVFQLQPTLCPGLQKDPRKSSVPCRVQLIVLQILWFLANPRQTHGTGKSENKPETADNMIDCGGFQSKLMVWPTPKMAPRRSQDLRKKHIAIKRDLIPHNIVRCSCKFIAQCLCRYSAVSFRFLTLIKPLGRIMVPNAKIGRFHKGP